MFENFWGNTHVVEALERMIAGDRISQTLLFAGPEGVGKATLARRFGAALMGDPEKIEHDDAITKNLPPGSGKRQVPATLRSNDAADGCRPSPDSTA